MIPFIPIYLFFSLFTFWFAFIFLSFYFRYNLKIFAFLYSAERKKNRERNVFFFHFMPLLKPLAPLFPFPAEEHVVFIFYFDDTGSVVVLCCWLSVVRSFIHSSVFFSSFFVIWLCFSFFRCYSSSFAQLSC